MQIVDRVIFDSTTAADGTWQDISLMPSWSLHVVGLEGTVWVEVSNDPNVRSDGSALAAPSAPTISSVPATSYNSNPGTYLAKVTYLVNGETVASAASASQLVAAGNTLQVASPAPDTGGFATGYNVYVSLNGGLYYLQNEVTIPIGSPFTLVNVKTGGIPAPSVGTAKVPNVGVSICGNLGGLTFTAAPVGSNAGSFAETQIVADSGNGNQAMVSASCLVFKWLRVRKSATAQTKETIAYLMGQNG